MTAQRKQLNIRLSAETEALLDALGPAMKSVIGANLSKADVIQAGLSELKKKYLPDWKYQPPADAEPPRARGRPAGSKTAPEKKKPPKRKGGAQ